MVLKHNSEQQRKQFKIWEIQDTLPQRNLVRQETLSQDLMLIHLGQQEQAAPCKVQHLKYQTIINVT